MIWKLLFFFLSPLSIIENQGGSGGVSVGGHHGHNLNKPVRKSSWRFPGSGSSGPPSASHPGVGPRGDSSSVEEEFFCLTPEDARSIASSGCRSRNASSTSVSSTKMFPVQMGGLPDTKIFSVAVESRPSDHHASDVMVISDVDTDFTGRFAVVSTTATTSASSTRKPIQQQQQSVSEKPSKKVVEKTEIKKVAVAAAAAEPASIEVEVSKPSAAVGKTGNGKGRGGKKNRKSRSSEESAEESSSSNATSASTSRVDKKPQKECDSDFDNVPLMKTKAATDFGFAPLKTDDFCREVTPKMEEEEVFEMTSNKGDTKSVDTTEDLLADALLSVVDDDDDDFTKHFAVEEKQARPISPTPSEDFTEMKSCSESKNVDPEQDEDPEDNFFIREKKSTSPEPEDEEEVQEKCFGIPVNLVSSPKMSCFEDMFGSDTGSKIVKSIEFATRLYGNDDDEEEVEEEEEDVTKSFNRSSTNKKSDGGSSVIDSSEDDVEFKPVSRRQKRTKKKDDLDEPGTPGSCYADSESSLQDDPPRSIGGGPEKQEGWSFEADDLDISRLIAEVVSHQAKMHEEAATVPATEEKTSLEDIFKFDSELAGTSRRRHVGRDHDNEDDDNNNEDEDEDDEEKSSNIATTTTTDDSENDYQVSKDIGTSKKVMSTSLNVGYEENVGGGVTGECDLRGATSLTQSLVCAGSTSAESSSVGNSPNPKKNKNKSKRKKRR